MDEENPFVVRKALPHGVPDGVPDGAIFFLTVCGKDRDQPILTNGEISTLLINAVRHYHDQQTWYCHLFLVMPDHVHGLFSFPPESEMKQLVTNWKSFTGRRGGFRWQSDFFDHRLRSDESFDEKASYIRMNPVRAGLVEEPDAWPHVWEAG